MLAQLIGLLALAAQQGSIAESGAPADAEREALTRAALDDINRRAHSQADSALSRWNRIEEELKQPALPRWAGTFSWSPFRTGGHYSVAPLSGMTASESNCTWFWWNEGALTASGERWFDAVLALPLEALPNERTGRVRPREAIRFHLVPWYDRDFLVPESRMLAFCSVFNTCGAPNTLRKELDHRFASRANGRAPVRDPRGLAELPELPPEYRAYVLDHEVTGRVVAVGTTAKCDASDEYSPFETRVDVEFGSEEPLVAGMTLVFRATARQEYGAGEIIEARPRACRLAFRHHGPPISAIEIGDAVTAGFDLGARHVPSPAERAEVELAQRVWSARPGARERLQRIEHERAAPDLPAWTGTFTAPRGDLTYWASPQAGLVARSGIGAAGTERWNHGAIVSSGDRSIEVELVLPHDALTTARRSEFVAGTASRFHLVTWCDRDFLTPEHRVVDLCNAFNARATGVGGAATDTGVPSRDNGRTFAAGDAEFAAPPAVPAEFRKYLLAGPVSGRVTGIEPAQPCGEFADGVEKLQTIVSADVGSADGLWPGMLLWLDDVAGFGPGEIVDVTEHTCHIQFRHRARATGTAQIGAPLTSKLPQRTR